MKGGVRQVTRLVKHDQKLVGLERLVVAVMALLLIVQWTVLTFESNLQWAIDTAGDVDGMSTHMEDKDLRSESGAFKSDPPVYAINSDVEDTISKTSVTTVTKIARSAPSIKPNLHENLEEKPVKRHLRSISHIDKDNAFPDIQSVVNVKEQRTKNDMASIDRIDNDYPSADVIKSILSEQHQIVPYNNGLYTHEWLSFDNGMHTLDDMVVVYEILYAFIAAFQREGIPIFLGFGSHIGARRHHGIIPFSEKDIDLQVFSTDEMRVLSIVRGVLQTRESWSTIIVELDEFGFGYRLNAESMKQHGLKYYIEFWLFGNVGNDRGQFYPNKVWCVGREPRSKRNRGKTGCSRSYIHYAGVYPPKFDHEDYFPPVYQVFGSHKVPIPRTSKELETFDYNEENWNTTCGSHRGYDSESQRWVNVPEEERKCSNLYDKYPFVFKTENGMEELRQGEVVIHKSRIET
eukprot:CAMPEP_0183719798 /NCGR_PEP_ID=MMETSP0737-20130205/12593_1 /TAXON_ID=385413 /ORGANISM="Thalassiosira miniscula, Strain CCMP1093" /LENGTH=460 /DNA_ID=CAMNT_0025949551 /DNA_START=213 /DNA_END=1595 /DNA_ORIENTATION=-